MPIKLTTFCYEVQFSPIKKFEYIFLVICNMYGCGATDLLGPKPCRFLPYWASSVWRTYIYIIARAWTIHLTHSLCMHCEPNKADSPPNFNYNSEVPNQRTFKSKNFCLWSYILLLTLILRRTHHQEDITCVHSFAVTAQGHFKLLFWLTPTTNLQFFGHEGPTTNGKSKEMKIKWPPGAHVCAVYLFTGKNGLADPPCF